MSDAGIVLSEGADGIMRITLNRPDRANSIGPESRELVMALLAEADQDPDIRVVLIRSTGKHFCAGGDVGKISGSFDAPRPIGSTMRAMSGPQNFITAILDCSKPVVAMVQGPAAGLGGVLALACDLIVASEEAWFSQPFVLRGLSLDSASGYILPRRVGLQKAKELVFLGDRLPASEALALGMVNRVCPADKLEEVTEELVGRLAKAATVAIGLAKKQLNASLDGDRQSAFQAEAMAQEINSRTDDIKEGVKAFMEKRQPEFRGR